MQPTSQDNQNSQIDDKDNSRMISDGSLGVFTVVASILLLWGYLWFKGTGVLGTSQSINVYFHEVAQLDDNAAVYIDGIRVGMVDKLEWQNEHRVLVRVRITSRRVVVPQGSTFKILTNGIVGAKYIEIVIPHVPDVKAGLPPLPDNSEVQGEDPARPELAINKLVIALSNIDPQRLQRNFEEDRKRLVRAADQLSTLAIKTMPVVDHALPLERDLTQIAHDLRGVARKVSRLLDDPNFTGDIKETTTKLKETADSVQVTVREINTTLADKALRRDLLASLESLRLATEHVENSVAAVTKMSGDSKLRGDVKDILAQARQTLDKVDSMFSRPGYGHDLKLTLVSTREALGHLDSLARQLNQILDKRAPLVHLMFGRPGKLEAPTTLVVPDKDKLLVPRSGTEKPKAKAKADAKARAEEKAAEVKLAPDAIIDTINESLPPVVTPPVQPSSRIVAPQP